MPGSISKAYIKHPANRVTGKIIKAMRKGGHLLLDNGVLYILSGNYMYKVNVSGFKPGDSPIEGAKLPFEDIASFVFAYPFVNNAHDSHPYNLMKGPDGDIYITDAGANAIIHRKSAGHMMYLRRYRALPIQHQ